MVWSKPKPVVAAGIKLLRDRLPADVGVATIHPRIWPRRFVKFTRAGGGMSNPVTDTARVLVECYADSDSACEDLINECRQVLYNCQGVTVTVGGNQPTDVFLRGFDNENGPVQLPDPDVPDHRRWQFQGDLLVSPN